jgi:hypothetical protein
MHHFIIDRKTGVRWKDPVSRTVTFAGTFYPKITHHASSLFINLPGIHTGPDEGAKTIENRGCGATGCTHFLFIFKILTNHPLFFIENSTGINIKSLNSLSPLPLPVLCMASRIVSRSIVVKNEYKKEVE